MYAYRTHVYIYIYIYSCKKLKQLFECDNENEYTQSTKFIRHTNTQIQNQIQIQNTHTLHSVESKDVHEKRASKHHKCTKNYELQNFQKTSSVPC